MLFFFDNIKWITKNKLGDKQAYTMFCTFVKFLANKGENIS